MPFSFTTDSDGQFTNCFHSESDRWIHSKKNPDLEASRQVSQSLHSKPHTLILIGNGALFYLKHLLSICLNDKRKDLLVKSIYFWEPIPEIVDDDLFLKEIASLTKFFQSVQIDFHFYISDEKFSEGIRKLFSNAESILGSHPIGNSQQSVGMNTSSQNGIQLFCHPFYRREYTELCEKYESLIQNLRTNIISPTKSINQNTIQYFSRKWTSNYFQNMIEAERIRILKPNQFSGDFPAMFVGASPILEDQWNWIKESKDYIYIFSSDTALRALLMNNIIPDCLVSVDPGRGTHFHLMNNKSIFIQSITWLGGSRIQFRSPCQSLLFLTNHPLDQWIAEINHIPESWILDNPSRNISGMCIRLAQYLGFSSIYLAGFNLKSQSDKTHVRGTGYESYYLPLVNRKKSLSSFYPKKTYGSYFSQKNSESMQAILAEKEIVIKILENDSTSLASLNQIANKIPLSYLEFSLPASLYFNVILGQEISGISKQAVKRFQSQFL